MKNVPAWVRPRSFSAVLGVGSSAPRPRPAGRPYRARSPVKRCLRVIAMVVPPIAVLARGSSPHLEAVDYDRAGLDEHAGRTGRPGPEVFGGGRLAADEHEAVAPV